MNQQGHIHSQQVILNQQSENQPLQFVSHSTPTRPVMQHHTSPPTQQLIIQQQSPPQQQQQYYVAAPQQQYYIQNNPNVRIVYEQPPQLHQVSNFSL